MERPFHGNGWTDTASNDPGSNDPRFTGFHGGNGGNFGAARTSDEVNGFRWKCQAVDLDPSVQISHFEIQCEGYDFDADDYVLRGEGG